MIINMLCFLFAALVIALDQFIKQWIKLTLDIGEIGPELIPGVLGLTRWENDGAMLNILSGQQWLLSGIALAAAIVLIMILLRYNEGFWGTLGLAAVLGGTVGNLIDRILNGGRVIDMFRTLFISFPIFNIADVFITLGFIVFLIHFIALSFKSSVHEGASDDYDTDDYDEEQEDAVYDEFPEIDAIVAAQAEQEFTAPSLNDSPQSQYASYSPEPQYPTQSPPTQEPIVPMSHDYEPVTDMTPDTSFSLDELSAELDSLEDYNVDDLLREYGFEDDENL